MSKKQNVNTDYTDDDYIEVMAAFDNADEDHDFNDLDSIFVTTKNETIQISDEPKKDRQSTKVYTDDEKSISLQDVLMKYNFVSDNDKQAVFTYNSNTIINFDDKVKKSKCKAKKPRVVNIDENTESVIKRLGKCRYDFEHDPIEHEEKQKKIDKNRVFEKQKSSTNECKNKPKIYKPKNNSK